ncbi:MAG: alkyl sulfatase dimerization domain-containing protein [Pacificimonas sp.]|jgi:alkyl sulfatase BDS1-like metallo-beta-lactamase superfamily hydrolase|nr:alkyl sulfatase dimerization domain-containing protein [Pacificimonas sp.]
MTRPAILLLAALPFLAAFAPAPPSAETIAANQAVAEALPLSDQADFTDARRGKVAELSAPILTAEGAVVWDPAALEFLAGVAPATVNPSLWRQSVLLAEHGLFEVVPGMWQVRGYDLANMTLIAGESGWIVIDPLLSVETARAGLALANETLGARPVSAVLFTHSHIDHFGGVGGLDMAEGTPVYAPHGFTEAAVSENLLAGPIMARRAALMFGATLPWGPRGQVGVGLGPGLSNGATSLAAVTNEIGPEGGTVVIDGVTFAFMDAAGTEAPAEFLFYLPEVNALHMAEVTSGTFHNALTLRGAEVRDTLAWSKVIDAALRRFGADADVVLASHHWPTWGAEAVTDYLANQRDMYRYVHDQTLRRANRGETMHEIAESLPEPDFAAEDFAVRGYYGTLQHNAKAVYQRYFGWWDGVPANFMPHPPAEEARRYVDALGGAERTAALARTAAADGDTRWAARLWNHLVFAGEGGSEAEEGLAAAYEQLGYRSESGAWRDYYLSAARELREGMPEPRGALGSADFLAAVPTAQLFDAMAVRFAPERAARTGFTVQFRFPDRDESLAMEVRSSVLIPRYGVDDPEAAATVTIDRADYDLLVAQQVTIPELAGSGRLTLAGDQTAVLALFGSLEAPTPQIAVVTP